MTTDDVLALADADSDAIPPLTQYQADYAAALLAAHRPSSPQAA